MSGSVLYDHTLLAMKREIESLKGKIARRDSKISKMKFDHIVEITDLKHTIETYRSIEANRLRKGIDIVTDMDLLRGL